MPDNVVSRVNAPSYLQPLTIGFTPRGMIADTVSARTRVAKQSDKYRVYGKNQLIERESRWFPGMIPNAIESRWSEDTYYADFSVLRHPLLDAELANNSTPENGGIDLEGKYTQTTTLAIAIARERRVADLFTNSANYSAGHVITKAGGTEYDVAGMGGSKVIDDLETIIGKVVDDNMVPASMVSLVVPEIVWRQAFKRNAELIDTIKYSERAVVTEDMVAQKLGIREVLHALASSAGPGPEVAGSDVVSGYTTTYLWGDTIWAGVRADADGVDMFAPFSRSFNWEAGTNGQPREVRRYRMADEGQRGDWIEVAEAIDDQKIVYKEAGAVIKNASSTI